MPPCRATTAAPPPESAAAWLLASTRSGTRLTHHAVPALPLQNKNELPDLVIHPLAAAARDQHDLFMNHEERTADPLYSVQCITHRHI